ncbi:MAG: SPOR domain-containing protein [Candidatus Hydrogenedentes bacterium]|nr:SPOR domain-containing protein [Candidatus Hydrogenedentota bacterium]
MANLRSTKARNGFDKVTAEFTSGQLVVGICVLIFVALITFALGVLVGRYEPPIKDQALQQLSAKSPSEPATPKASGVQASPRVDTVPLRDAAKTATPVPKPEPVVGSFTKQQERTGPRITELPPLPPPSVRPTAAQPSVAAPDARAKEPSTAPPVAAAATETKPTAVGPTVPLKEQRLEEEILSELQPVPDRDLIAEETKLAGNAAAPPAKPAEATSTAVKGWCVQLASFQGEGRQKKAEDYLKRVKQTEKLNAVVAPSKDDKYYRVVVIGYKDEATAKAAAAELRKKPGFKDVFVKALP